MRPVGGVVGPTLFGWLIESGQRSHIMWGYLAAAALMLVAAATEWRLGFAAVALRDAGVSPGRLSQTEDG